MTTPLHVYTAQKAAKRAAERQEKQQAQPDALPTVELAPPVAPPSDVVVAQIEGKLSDARAALQQADADLANASFAAITAPNEREADAHMALARRVRDQMQDRVTAIQAALSVALDKQTQSRAQAAQAAHAA